MSRELLLIDAFLSAFGLSRGAHSFGAKSGVISGPGDDCAALAPSPGLKLVATTDAVVEGVHFDLRRGAPEDFGYKALAVNLSDLAAAGARPRWFLCALGVPKRAGALQTARRVARGMSKLARGHRCALVGGNISRAKAWSITITALGEARAPRGRSGARPGDALVVAGALGEAALGLRLLHSRAVIRGGAARRAAQAQLRPRPLVAAGLAAQGLAAAAIDVSDGLLRDLSSLCEASGCAAEIECSQLPESRAARAASADHALALTGGEDYALLFAARPSRASALIAAVRRSGAAARTIGRFVAGRGIRLFERGEPRPLPTKPGWDHLA